MNYDINELEKLNIHMLRSLARRLGVKSPTILTKPDLIEAICNIDENAVNAKKETRGRPSADNDEFVSAFINNLQPKIVSSKLELATDTNSNEVDRQSSCDISGYIDILDGENYGYLRQFMVFNLKDDIFVSAEMIKKYQLRDGDYISVNSNFDKITGISFVTEVTRLNHEIPCYDRPDIKFAQKELPTEELCFMDNKESKLFSKFLRISRGERILIYGKKQSEINRYMLELAKNTKEEYMFLFYKSSDFVSSKMKNTYYIKNDIADTIQIKTLTLAIKHAQRLVEQGKHITIFINDLLHILNLYSSHSLIKFMIEEDVIKKLLNLINIAGKYRSLGSVTLVCAVATEFERGQFLYSSLESNFDIGLEISEINNLMVDCFGFNLINVNLKHSNILTKDEIEERNKMLLTFKDDFKRLMTKIENM